MKKIETTQAPAAIGPYSQGVEHNGFVYVSGQLPLDPATGSFPEGDVKDLTRQSMKNVIAILEAAGSSADKIIKTTIFLKDLANFGAVNEAYAEFFDGIAPARACVQVAALPKDAELEIEAVTWK